MDVHSVEDLARQLNVEWSGLRAGRQASSRETARIKKACQHLMPPDTSLALFGSLARGEFTDGSDVDWTLLVDGITIPEHLTVARQISEALKTLKFKAPGRTGTFANLASSHNLIHCIGGTTIRMQTQHGDLCCCWKQAQWEVMKHFGVSATTS